MRDLRVLNVQDFGAVGDSTTDDTEAIQWALSYADTIGGGHVVMPDSCYRITYSLVYGSNTIIEMGRGSRIYPDLTGNGASCFISNSRDTSEAWVTDVTFKNIRVNNGPISENAIGIYRCKRVLVDGCSVYSLGYHLVDNTASEDVTVRNCYAYSTGTRAIQMDNAVAGGAVLWELSDHTNVASVVGEYGDTDSLVSKRMLIENCVFESCAGGVQFHRWGGSNGIVDNCWFLNTGDASGAITIDSAWGTGITVTNCNFYGRQSSYGKAINCAGGNLTNVIIENNIVRGMAQGFNLGITYGGTGDVTIRNNDIDSIFVYGTAAAYAISVSGYNTAIQNNKISDHTFAKIGVGATDTSAWADSTWEAQDDRVAIRLDDVASALVTNNLMLNTYGVGMRVMGTSKSVDIIGNKYQGGVAGVVLAETCDSIRIIDNSFSGWAGLGWYGIYDGTSGADLLAYGNEFYGSWDIEESAWPRVYLADTLEVYNLFAKNATLTTTGPLFTMLSTANDGDCRLQMQSGPIVSGQSINIIDFERSGEASPDFQIISREASGVDQLEFSRDGNVGMLTFYNDSIDFMRPVSGFEMREDFLLYSPNPTAGAWSVDNHHPFMVRDRDSNIVITMNPVDFDTAAYPVLFRVGDRAIDGCDSRTLGYFSAYLTDPGAVESQAVYGIMEYYGDASYSQLGIHGMAQGKPAATDTQAVITGLQGFGHFGGTGGHVGVVRGVAAYAETKAGDTITGSVYDLTGIKGIARSRSAATVDTARSLWASAPYIDAPGTIGEAYAAFIEQPDHATNSNYALMLADMPPTKIGWTYDEDVVVIGFMDSAGVIDSLWHDKSDDRFAFSNNLNVNGNITMTGTVRGGTVLCIANDSLTLGDSTTTAKKIFRMGGTPYAPIFGYWGVMEWDPTTAAFSFRTSGASSAAAIYADRLQSAQYMYVDFNDVKDSSGILFCGTKGVLRYVKGIKRFLFNDSLHVLGNISLTGTVDGVDLAALNTGVAADSASWNVVADKIAVDTNFVTEGELEDSLDLYFDTAIVVDTIQGLLAPYFDSATVVDTAQALIAGSLASYFDSAAVVDTAQALDVILGNTLRSEFRDTVMAVVDTQTIAIPILSPATTMDLPLFELKDGLTIYKVSVICTGGTSVVFGLDEYNATGTSVDAVINADWTATAGTESELISFTNASLDAGDYLGVHITTVNGTPTALTITVKGY